MPDLISFVEHKAAHFKSAVETLEVALAQARAGEIASIAIAVVRPNGAVNTAFSATTEAARLMGAVALLQRRVIENVEVG